jgi:hypothetical protein
LVVLWKPLNAEVMRMDESESKTEVARPSLRQPMYRRRSHLTMTVHPDTIVRFARLTDRYRLPVGQIVDHLVASLDRCFDAEGKPVALTCITGEACRVGRRDVPEVL